jgi:hypothetical protein
MTSDAEAELAGYIAKFTPAMQERIRDCRAFAARFPDAVQLVYDNYNFLVIAFGPTARSSDAIFSLALTPAGSTCSSASAAPSCRTRPGFSAAAVSRSAVSPWRRPRPSVAPTSQL